MVKVRSVFWGSVLFYVSYLLMVALVALIPAYLESATQVTRISATQFSVSLPTPLIFKLIVLIPPMLMYLGFRMAVAGAELIVEYGSLGTCCLFETGGFPGYWEKMEDGRARPVRPYKGGWISNGDQFIQLPNSEKVHLLYVP